MSSWRDISTAPKDGSKILLRYWKGGKFSRTTRTRVFVITEGYFVPQQTVVWTDSQGQPHTHTYRYEWWVDSLGRLLEDTAAKASKNKVTHWMPLPEEPS